MDWINLSLVVLNCSLLMVNVHVIRLQIKELSNIEADKNVEGPKFIVKQNKKGNGVFTKTEAQEAAMEQLMSEKRGWD